MTQTLFLSRFFFACILCLYVVLFPRHTDTHRLHGRVVRAWKLNSRSLNKRRTARASPHPGKRNKKTGLSSDRAEMHRWEYCRVKVFIIFFFLCREEIKECLFIHSDGGQSDTAKSALSGRCWIFFFSFSSSYIRKNIQQRKANGRFRLFSFFSADTYLFFPSARYLSILSIYHSFPIWNIQHDSMHLNQDIYCCVLPFALPNFLAMCHHTADFTCR